MLGCMWREERLERAPDPGLARLGPGPGIVGEADMGARIARGLRADARALRLLWSPAPCSASGVSGDTVTLRLTSRNCPV